MYNSSDEDDACEATTKQSAFDVLMAPPCKKAKVVNEVDPIVIAVIYIRWLKWIDPSEPLHGCPYVGQAVRSGNTAEEVAAARWGEENSYAKRLNKSVGLMHELKVHGQTAFHNEIVDSKRGPRSEVQAWANEREIALIAEHGGPLRDPSARCKQTLNLTKGGKQGCNFEGRDASRTVAWLHFQDEMQEYVECYGTSLVPCSYMASSGHKLGQQLVSVRQGVLFRGHPDEANRVKWLESLPYWAWKANQTAEFRDGCSKRAKKQFESQEKRDERSKMSQKMWDNASDDMRTRHANAVTVAKSTPDAKTAQSERSKAMWANADEATLAEWARVRSEIQWTPGARKALSERSKAMWAADGAKAAQSERKKAEFAAKHAVVLAALPESERKKKQTQYDKNRRGGANRRGKAEALLKLSEYTDKGRQWCKNNLTKAQKEGVVFFQNEHGVWCARMGNQGGCAGSSAEHALTVAPEATVAA
jgi:hypothetical protein